MVTYSLKVNLMEVLCTGTFTAPGKGDIFTITGGMVSLGPPEGEAVVLAHPDGNIREPITRAAGIRGRNLLSFIVRF